MSDDAPTREDRPRRRWPFGWLGLLALAWAIYELTHQPGLAAILVCMKFGVEDFRLAGWLYRRDPWRPRARATFCAYMAWGLWKVAIVALLMCVAFTALIVADPNFPRLGPPRETVLGAILATVTSFALSALFTLLAIGLGLAGRCRLWVGRVAWEGGRWPPVSPRRPPRSRLGWLVMTPAAIALFAAFGLVISHPMRFGLHEWLAGGLLFSSPALLALLRDAVAARVGALRPAECWPAEEVL